MKKITLGEKVVVSDPCYEIPTWCQAVIENVLPGEYYCVVLEKDGRCGELLVTHEDFYHRIPNWELSDYDIGVDSGQCGVFDFPSYRNDNIVPNMFDVPNETNTDWNYKGWKDDGEKWYGKVCEYTLFPEYGHGGYENGYVSSSGYGDGGYNLYLSKNSNGQIDGFKIVFIGDEETDEYFPEYGEEENYEDNDYPEYEVR